MTSWTLADIRSYYELHAERILPHLRGRLVRRYPPGSQDSTVTSLPELLELVVTGAGGFAVPARRLDDASDTVDRLVVHLRTGEGADIATAAMSAQAIAEQLIADGHHVVALTDGVGGLFLIAPVASQPAVVALQYLAGQAKKLADRAPEIATTDPLQSQGRVMIDISGTDPGKVTPAPYTLVPSADAGLVVPVTLDEVSAASAGMPLDLEPEDLPNRLAVWGDLTIGLHGSGRSPA